MLTPHQVAARLGFGPIPEGATLLHGCEVRLCCRYGPGHVGVGTQSQNMRHAVARGRAVGPRPGRVDVRGTVGASRAVQAALRDAVDRSPDGLAACWRRSSPPVTRCGTSTRCSTSSTMPPGRWPAGSDPDGTR